MARAPQELKEAFRHRFPEAPEPLLYRAPGRVNLIGEHTDYTLGYVMPIALELACYTAWAPAAGDRLEAHSSNLGETRSWPVGEVAQVAPRGDWSDYVAGVARELVAAGMPVEPARLLIESTVPIGGGLSSSAALEVAVALALLAGRPMDRLELARLCHRAEVGFVGLPCGIMDQYISLFARPHAALWIDCRDLSCRVVRLPEQARILAVNSMVRHELGGSAYRDRVEECRRALEAIRQADPGSQSLRDARPEHLALLEDAPLLRARHVIGENARVGEFAAACARGDATAMGRLMVASHRSLQQDYEVSCQELDFLVSTALSVQGVLGARMTGGGFGGCTVNLMAAQAEPVFRERITLAYEAEFGRTPEIYDCRPSGGAGPLEI